MTQKEMHLIGAINEDCPNWGIFYFEHDIAPLYGAVESKVVPPHIYIYRDYDECTLRNEIQPDLTISDKFGQVIDLYYIKMED